MGFGEYQEPIFDVLKQIYDGEWLLEYLINHEKIKLFESLADNNPEVAIYHKGKLEILNAIITS